MYGLGEHYNSLRKIQYNLTAFSTMVYVFELPPLSSSTIRLTNNPSNYLFPQAHVRCEMPFQLPNERTRTSGPLPLLSPHLYSLSSSHWASAAIIPFGTGFFRSPAIHIVQHDSCNCLFSSPSPLVRCVGPPSPTTTLSLRFSSLFLREPLASV